MGSQYQLAQDMFVDQQRTFIGALENNPDISIVLHGTGSPGNIVPTAQEIALFFASNADEVSSHFIIDQNGTIVQCVRLSDGAAGNCCVEPGYDSYWDQYLKKYGNLNKCTISIEHTNNVDNSLALSQRQRAASFTLVGWLCKKYNIPPERIKTHASIDPQSRAHCPGNYPYDDLITAVKQGNQPMPKQATISETTVITDLQKAEDELAQVETELQALRGIVTVTGPTVIE